VAVRPIGPGDLTWVLERNQANVPAVGSLDREKLAWYVDVTPVAVVAEVDGVPAGFLLGFAEGSDYASPNYRWFAARYPTFVYVDRVVVDDAHQGRGIGRVLYDHLVDWSAGTRPVLCAEVNVDPPNEGSLAFHARYGFAEVGRQEPYGDGVRVALLACPLPR
jgi:predicted GNAT superfamily acetyltransferase